MFNLIASLFGGPSAAECTTEDDAIVSSVRGAHMMMCLENQTNEAYHTLKKILNVFLHFIIANHTIDYISEMFEIRTFVSPLVSLLPSSLSNELVVVYQQPSPAPLPAVSKGMFVCGKLFKLTATFAGNV